LTSDPFRPVSFSCRYRSIQHRCNLLFELSELTAEAGHLLAAEPAGNKRRPLSRNLYNLLEKDIVPPLLKQQMVRPK